MNLNASMTQFASPERADSDTIAAQHALLLGLPGFQQILDMVPSLVVVLNEERQIVFSNKTLLDFMGGKPLASVLGCRPGEALNCTYSDRNAAGCGTTEFCSQCGSAKAILSSQKGKAAVDACELLRKDGDALDLSVWSTPFEVAGKSFTFYAMLDGSGEKRRRALERIFFHDLLNTAGGLYGYADLLSETVPADEETGQFARSIFDLSGSMIDEIRAQKELSAAETNELVPEWKPIDSLALAREVAAQYQAHEVAKGKSVAVAADSASVTVLTDRTLLKRVVANMTKNALEASKPGQTVTLRCLHDKDAVAFTVHNPTFMPRENQLQVFKRSFSTKGRGRGLGTYSIKLLTERYLGGQVFFTSSPEEGTTFTALLPLDSPGAARE